MHNAKQSAALALLAIVAGFAGGLLANSMRGHQNAQRAPGIVQAKQFEVIGTNGMERARFGVESGDLPTLILFGPDGKKRLWMGLDNVNESLITMRDNAGEDRVYLGHETSDTASPQDDDWSVSFRGAGDTDRLAGIGMIKSYPSRKPRGIVVARDEFGRWSSIRP
jgi:hypothetical protein